MTATRPRALAHRGTVAASALLVDTEWFEEAVARERVLAAWEQGAVVHRTTCGLLIVWPAPRWLRVDEAPGVVFTREHGVLASMPLTAEAARALSVSSSAMITARAGELAVESLTAAPRVDPADWLALGVTPVKTASLGDAPPRPVLERDDPSPQARPLFGEHVPPADGRAVTIANRLRGGARGGSGSASLRGLGIVLAAAVAWLSRLRAAFGARTADAPAGDALTRPRTPLFAFWRALVARWFARLAQTIGLARILGARQAAYLRRMLDLFDSQNFDEALRHAIPLAGLDGSSDAPRAPLIGVPSPRATLEIRAPRTIASSSIGADGELWAHLRTTYRKAFERLDATGQHERAAFVLAELLNSAAEAVAYLERHGRARLAAEIAEARGLPPGLIVRQWFLAGDRARAVEIARRTGAFSDAVARLERSGDRENAEGLRCAWGEALARAGNYALAASVVIDVEAARGDALQWLDAAWSAGGLMQAHAAALKLSLSEDPTERERASIREMLEADDPDASSIRREMAMAMLARAGSPWTRVIARPLARALVRDAAINGSDETRDTMTRLVALSTDTALHSDLPVMASSPRVSLATRASPVVIHVPGTERGAAPIESLAAAPRGGVLVALGEAGVRWLARDGRCLAEFDVPAHCLVPSDHGNRVLALARRGDAWRVSRIDLSSRRARAWGETILSDWADTFDGDTWVIVRDAEVLALDACGDRIRALRRIDGLQGAFVAIARSPSALAVLAVKADEVERWRFDLPEWVLRERKAIVDTRRGISHRLIRPFLDGDGYSACGTDDLDGSGTLRIVSKAGLTDVRIADASGAGLYLTTCGPWLATTVCVDALARVQLWDLTGRERLRVELAARSAVCVRLETGTLWIGDDCGHAMRIALDDGRVLQRWHVR